MTKRAILYARVSGDDRDTEGRNVRGQLDMCRDYAHLRGWQIVAELAEDERGAKGASFDLPKLNQAQEMARNGEFDVLVTREMDRFARSLAKQLIIERDFAQNGVQVEYVIGEYDDSPEGQLSKHVRAVIAEYERLKIAERTIRGRQNKVKAGQVIVGGSPPFGYTLTDNDKLEIDPGTARIVCMIFDWYTVGDGERGPMSISEITRKLSAIKLLSPMDRRKNSRKQRAPGEWNYSTVHNMLKTQTYIGVWHYGKRKRTEDGAGRWIKNDPKQLIAVAVPAIVSQETWDAVRTRMAYNRQRLRPKKFHYLLSGRVTCGLCGHKMGGCGTIQRGWLARYYRCPSSMVTPAVLGGCKLPNFRADQVETAVWQWVKEWMTDPAQLASGLEEYQAKSEQTSDQLRDRLAIIGDLLTLKHLQLERAVDTYLAGEMVKSKLAQHAAQLEMEISALEREQAALQAAVDAQTLTVEQIQTVQTFAGQIAQGLDKAEASFDTRRGIIEALNVEATLTVEDGQKVVYVSCIIERNQKRGVLSIVTVYDGQQVKTALDLVFSKRIVLPPGRKRPKKG